jgi:acyl-CoA synthetase (AMP-forming)/AMP-acid ligase II
VIATCNLPGSSESDSLATCLADPRREFTTLVELLQWRAREQPDQRAYTYLPDREGQEVHLTYAELNRKAQVIAAGLLSSIAPGQFVLLLYPPGLEFIAAFFGALYAGVSAVPAYPPHPARINAMLPRLQNMAAHAGVAAVLTTTAIQSVAEPLLQQVPVLANLHWFATDKPADTAKQWQPLPMSTDALAYVQYTSGSTAAPKGVMLSHKNLLHNSALIYRCFSHSSMSRGVIWLPPYHDMGLIGGVLQPLYGGFPVILMSPAAFLLRPIRWLQTISHSKATTSGGPNFAYDLCIRKTTPEQRATLDLSDWEIAFCGAEPIHPDTLDRFVEAFAPNGFRREAFYPCYGLAEASLFVTGALKPASSALLSTGKAILDGKQETMTKVTHRGTRRLISCGTVPPGQTVNIIDPESCIRVSSGQVGEIWVSGPSIACGYLHQPDETESTFRAFVADTGEGPFLRTGDLGFFHEGELFITGRCKDLIIIGGRNHYPEDIEHTVVQSHPFLQPGNCAAFSVDVGSEERLVILIELLRCHLPAARRLPIADGPAVRSKDGPVIDFKSLIQTTRQAVAEHNDLSTHAVLLLKPASLPRTSSGKIQRHACREGFLAGTLNIVEEF